MVAGRSERARGPLKVTAPTSFGRLHIAPHLKPFLDANPEIELELDLTDDFVDLVSSGIDIAVRIGTLPDSSFIAQRLAPNRRMLCATPGYIADHGEPRSEEHTSELQSLMRTSYAVFCLKKKKA